MTGQQRDLMAVVGSGTVVLGVYVAFGLGMALIAAGVAVVAVAILSTIAAAR